jgi:hypothetical protein
MPTRPQGIVAGDVIEDRRPVRAGNSGFGHGAWRAQPLARFDDEASARASERCVRGDKRLAVGRSRDASREQFGTFDHAALWIRGGTFN